MIPIEDFTDITLAIEDTDEDDEDDEDNEDDEEDLTDVTLVSDDTYWTDSSYQLTEVINWWKFSTDGSYQMMEVINLFTD